MATKIRSRLEFLLTLLAVLWLAWLGRGFGSEDWLRGADDRYRRDVELRVELPPEVRRGGFVGRVCDGFGDWLPAGEGALCREFRRSGLLTRLQAGLSGPAAEPSPPVKPVTAEIRRRVREALPALTAAHEALARGWFEPLAAAEREREEWERHAAEGFVEDEEDRPGSSEEQSRPYRETYRLEVRAGRASPKALECAWSYLSRRLEQAPAASAENAPVQALLGLAALLDGDVGKLPAAAFGTAAGWDARETRMGCAGSPADGMQPLDAVREAAALVKLARVSADNAAKAAAVQDLLPKAPWQLAVWALTGLMVLAVGRKAALPQRALFVSLLLWAMAAAVTRPHLEWLGGNALRFLAGGWQVPAILAGTAFAALFLAPRRQVPASSPASGMGYAGFVLFTGLGWWVLLDLSAYGHFENRFQGLYQQGNLFAAFLVVSLVPVLRAPLAATGLGALSFWPLVAAGTNRRAWLGWGLGLLAAALLLVLAGVFLRGHRQLTSEIFRAFLVVGLSWFLLVRAEPLVSPWLKLPPRPGETRFGAWSREQAYRLKFAAPLLPLLVLVLGGLLVTDDKGPLLVILYAAAIFVGVGAALFVSGKAGWAVGIASGMAVLGVYVWSLSWALLRYGGQLGSRIRERVESAQQPFLAGNDQMAHVLWFQEAAGEAGGFGLGAAPWCGEMAGGCRGVPPQIQSDYLFTALLGVFGPLMSWGLLALFVLWLWRLARSHPAVTSGRADSDDPGQAWLSWMTLCWAGLTLTQMAVTVAGNLCWLPLTGITFPFVSFGAWSLLANAFFLALGLNLNRKVP